MNLLSFATSLVNVADKAVTAVQDAKLVFTYASQVMNAAETAWANDKTAGATKKQMVMDAAQAFATALGANWSLLESALAAWIEVTIAAYNAAAALIPNAPTVDATKVDAVVQQGEQAAQVLVSAAVPVAAALQPATPTVAQGL